VTCIHARQRNPNGGDRVTARSAWTPHRAFPPQHRGCAIIEEAPIPLIDARSLWQWAEKLAGEQQEPFALVLAELAMAARRGELAVGSPKPPDRLLDTIAEAARVESTVTVKPLPRDEGIWTVAQRIMIDTPDGERWLANRLAISSNPEASEGRPKGRRGPRPGALDRYADSDRRLFPEIERIMHEEQMSVTAAARKLAEQDRVSGIGISVSRARRLAARFIAEQSKL
jgi:hypothetical protein